ncbi:Gfo/Idh/MocA family protein [Acetobacterium malicum]|uniref:Gfo/Idh/MocA family oxidoreductase n=1 Tax=Acetobacterium malicum TaxID=52692 RepID=A0ABR6YTA1_9FIRM|nr:Gfo/Idh/MocA family oxidoreductase [Acetobacterium malicum]MBC3898381.1 gfo/Idh/MocA family oxidoreductase [Acetobacterium malicum]
MGLKYALIGCGKISANHIAAARANDLDIVALCDVYPDSMNTLISKFELPETIHQYTDHQALIQNEKLDLVAICTENGKHGSIALDFIESGCNLIIEKPIALSLEEADEIIKRSKEKNVKVSACHQNRFNQSVIEIRKALDQKRFGKLFYGTAHIRWNRGREYYAGSKWRGTWEHDGGALMNQCIHNIDLLRWMMGDDIIEVVGMTDNLNHPYIEAEDFGIALIRFANGSYGIVEGTTTIYPKNLEETLYLFGEKGTVKAAGQSVNIIEEWQFSDARDDSEEIKERFSKNPPNVYGHGHTPYYADVIDAIKNDREPSITAEDGRRAVELILAIYKSAAEGQRIRLPLEKCSTTDFKGRFEK